HFSCWRERPRRFARRNRWRVGCTEWPGAVQRGCGQTLPNVAVMKGKLWHLPPRSYLIHRGAKCRRRYTKSWPACRRNTERRWCSATWKGNLSAKQRGNWVAGKVSCTAASTGDASVCGNGCCAAALHCPLLCLRLG